MIDIFGIPIETVAAVFWTVLGCILYATLFVLVFSLSVIVFGCCIYGLYCGAKMTRDFVRSEMEGWDW